jgi:pyrimidine operon attenuation protein/uracil phosphoribosyltransferase
MNTHGGAVVTTKNKVILDDKKIARALARISHEILERNSDVNSIAIIGILTRGAFLARRIARLIEELEGVKVPVGLMDISLYRDDVHQKLDQPIIQRTDIIFPVKDKNIVLVDDVLFTGRTIRAALNHIVDFGRPRTIQLAVLVDRGHRELPIKADFVGVNIPTSRSDQVVLEVKEKEGLDQVSVVSGSADATESNPKTAPAPKAKPAAGKKKPAVKSTGKGGKR